MAEKDDIQQHCFRVSQEKSLVLHYSLTDVFFLCHPLRRILSQLGHSVTSIFSHLRHPLTSVFFPLCHPLTSVFFSLCHPLTSRARSGEPVTVKPLCLWIPDQVGNDKRGAVGNDEKKRGTEVERACRE